MSAICPECDSPIDVDEFDVDIGDELDMREWGMYMILVARCLERIGDMPSTFRDEDTRHFLRDTDTAMAKLLREDPRPLYVTGEEAALSLLDEAGVARHRYLSRLGPDVLEVATTPAIVRARLHAGGEVSVRNVASRRTAHAIRVAVAGHDVGRGLDAGVLRAGQVLNELMESNDEKVKLKAASAVRRPITG